MENDPESWIGQGPWKDTENAQAELIVFSISCTRDAISDFLADIMAPYASLIVSSLIIYEVEMDSCVTKELQTGQKCFNFVPFLRLFPTSFSFPSVFSNLHL